MTDGQEERLDALLREAARNYNAPPPAPRAEMWERVMARRAAFRAADAAPAPVIKLLPGRWRPLLRLGVGIAALLAVGVAIGRLTAPGQVTPPSVAAGSAAAAADRAAEPAGAALATRLALAQHLGRAEAFLTDFESRRPSADFPSQARELLGTTRLLLDSKRLNDLRARKLLEDLELVLTQIVTFDSTDRREELGFITDGLTQSQLRSRLRSAIPAGAATRM